MCAERCQSTLQDGFEVHEIPVNKEGKVDLEFLEKNVDEDTLLISVMAVNNETGCSSPLKKLEKLPKDVEYYFIQILRKLYFLNGITLIHYS